MKTFLLWQSRAVPVRYFFRMWCHLLPLFTWGIQKGVTPLPASHPRKTNYACTVDSHAQADPGDQARDGRLFYPCAICAPSGCSFVFGLLVWFYHRFPNPTQIGIKPFQTRHTHALCTAQALLTEWPRKWRAFENFADLSCNTLLFLMESWKTPAAPQSCLQNSSNPRTQFTIEVVIPPVVNVGIFCRLKGFRQIRIHQ